MIPRIVGANALGTELVERNRGTVVGNGTGKNLQLSAAVISGCQIQTGG